MKSQTGSCKVSPLVNSELSGRGGMSSDHRHSLHKRLVSALYVRAAGTLLVAPIHGHRAIPQITLLNAEFQDAGAKGVVLLENFCFQGQRHEIALIIQYCSARSPGRAACT